MSIARGLSRWYKAYTEMLTKHPVKVQAIQTAILCGTGDLIAQHVVEQSKLTEFNLRRFVVFSAFGGLFVGPSLRIWYGLLESNLKGSHYVVTAKKVLLDQGLVAPTFLCVTLTVLNACAGKNLTEIKEKFKSDYFDILLTNYKIWPAVQFINFAFVPVNYQVPLSQVIGVGWNTYLSWKAHQTPET